VINTAELLTDFGRTPSSGTLEPVSRVDGAAPVLRVVVSTQKKATKAKRQISAQNVYGLGLVTP
jgi:hypothetical protein